MDEELVTQAQIEKWIDDEEDEFNVTTFRMKHLIGAEDENFGTAISRLRDKKKIKMLGRGWYRKIKPIQPLKIKGVMSEDYFDMGFPKSHTDYSTFGLEDLVLVSQGDLIIIAGTSNAGKTTLAHNILAENIEIKPNLMGNEYKSNDGFLMPKYLRRFKRFDWANLINGTKGLNFDVYPIDDNYDDYISMYGRDKLNIVDWLGLEKDWFRMGKILKDIKNSVGSGVAVVVLQKKHGVKYAYGAEGTEQFADIYMTIDPLGKHEGRLTLGKVKEPKDRTRLNASSRMWGYETTDGSNLLNIRPLRICYKCHGKGYTNMGGKCDTCIEKGYVDLDNPL